MAKTKRGFIFASFIVSCAATVLAILSLATENWTNASIKFVIDNKTSDINYGLFSGIFKQNLLGSYNTKSITIACIYSENVCAYSYEETGDKRIEDINGILNGITCLNKNVQTSILIKQNFTIDDIDDSIEVFEENKVMFTRKTPAKLIYNVQQINNKNETKKIKRDAIDLYDTSTLRDCDPTFLNSGLWLMTIIFLLLAILMGVLTAILSVMNAAGNPISPWLNIWGLYIWNGSTAFLYLMTLIMYGIEYNLFINYNVGIIETLKAQYINDEALLGYSYWVLLGSMFLHTTNCALFYSRQYLIDREPEIVEDKYDTHTDGMIFVY